MRHHNTKAFAAALGLDERLRGNLCNIDARDVLANGTIAPSRLSGVTGVLLTERAEVEGAQGEHAERLRSILDLIPQMVWSMRADGVDHYYNEQWADYTGVRLNDDRDTRLALIHPEDRDAAKSAWEEALLEKDTYDHEYRLRHHSGEYRWVHSRARRQKSPSGQGLYWYGAVSDIHDRKIGELALAESDLLHRSILEASSDCIKILGQAGALELMNPSGKCAMEIDDI